MNHKPRKRFGQNFLHDHSIINQILASAYPSPGQHWIEIGPGQGALTKPLLQHDIKLDVIELDRDLVQLLKLKFPNQKNLTIHSADALKFDVSKLAETDGELHIIGNLPYNISTPLLFHLLESSEKIAEMYFMLQKDVVDRICAGPGSKKYGRLSIMLQNHYETDSLFDVPPESFSPAPKVVSAVIKLTPHQTPPALITNHDDFNAVVKQAFSQKRKTLRNSLGRYFSEQEISKLSIDPGLRAESVSLQDYAKLSNFYSEK